MLAERALADVIRGPTNTSRLRLAPRHPYAPVGCTTYAHVDPAKAALRAGSYQWESERGKTGDEGESHLDEEPQAMDGCVDWSQFGTDSENEDNGQS